MVRFGIALVGLLLLLTLGGCSLTAQPGYETYDAAPQPGAVEDAGTALHAKGEAFYDGLNVALATNPFGTEIDLADLTDFEWDRVCSFDEGDSHTFVNERLNGEVFMASGYIYSQHHLVFTQQGKVVFDVPLAPKQLYFDTPDTESCITREEAIFRIEELASMEEPYNRYLARVKGP